VDQIAFVGHATLLNADRPGTGHQFSRAIQRRRGTRASVASDGSPVIPSASAVTTNHHLTMFHLVLAVRTSSKADTDDTYLDALYSHIVSKVASALKYEQLRRLYIRKEAELILSIKEDAALSSMYIYA
jgi:hypothetical protein